LRIGNLSAGIGPPLLEPQGETLPVQIAGNGPRFTPSTGWPPSIGINGRFGSDWVAAFRRNHWPRCLGFRMLEHDLLRHTTEGTPQGGVVSPVLANIYLHHVLDEWFELDVRPRLKGNGILVRYADDSVMAFEALEDAKRVIDMLGKRLLRRDNQDERTLREHYWVRQYAFSSRLSRHSLQRYGLKLYPHKTRLVDVRIYRPEGACHPDRGGTAFDFLGFSPYPDQFLLWVRAVTFAPFLLVPSAARTRALAAAISNICPTDHAFIH
jgi:hypothetical protein